MLRRLLTLLLVAASTHAVASNQAWVQYGPRGVEVRALTSDNTCPAADIDGKTLPMQERAVPNAAYPARTCQLDLPSGTKKASVFGRPLMLPVDDPQTIVILGDTGCRMKGKLNAGGVFQACNDPKSWPFSLIAEVAAQQRPDLVVHVGDYHYRETPCPDSEGGCTGSPWGDTQAVWEADLLEPAHTLLRTAPWVFVRGNHEECKRGGKGWSRMFDPYPFDVEHGCNAMEDAWIVKLKGLDLGVVDNSSMDEGDEKTALSDSLKAQLHKLGEQSAGTPLWVLMHRPARSVVHVHAGTVIGGNATLAAGFDAATPSNLQYIWSGHLHAFEVMNWQDGSVPQIVTGHGGDVLDRDAPSTLDGLIQLGKQISTGWGQIGDFGFVLLKKHESKWELTNHDRFGNVTMRCELAKPIICAPVH